MFDFQDETQKEIVKSIEKLAQKELPKLQNDNNYPLPREFFTQLAKLGLTGLNIDEEFDGFGSIPITSMLVMETLARFNLGPAIFISVHGMVSGIINKYGSAPQKSKYLKSMSSGKLLGAFALTEPSAGSDAAALKSSAFKKNGKYILNGEKCYITSAGAADLYIVFARTSPDGGTKGISAFILNSTAKGLTISKPEKKMGCELSPIASLNFENIELEESSLLGNEGDGYKIALSGLAGGRINIAACANGLSTSAIEIATQHLLQRKQFGKTIGEFQGLQFILADMKIGLEAAKLLTWQAAHELTKAPKEKNNLSSSIAKCFATDTAMRITTDAVQLLGGAGYIKEYKVEQLMRDAKMLQIVEGTNQIQRLVIAREILG